MRTNLKRPPDDDNESEEQLLWSGGYSGREMAGSWLLAIVASVVVPLALRRGGAPAAVVAGVVAAIWVVPLGVLCYRKLSDYYELTDQRFLHKRGILVRRTDWIELIDIDDIAVVQGIVQRLLGVGEVRLTSTDRSHPELALIGIADVQQVCFQIDKARRDERRRRAVHIEAI